MCNWSGCNSQFKDKHSLFRHMYLNWPWYTCPYVCTYCEKGYSARYLLLSHMQEQTHISRHQIAINISARQPTILELQQRSVSWAEDAVLKGTITMEHFDRLKGKLTISVTDSTVSHQRNLQQYHTTLHLQHLFLPEIGHHLLMTASLPNSNSPM